MGVHKGHRYFPKVLLRSTSPLLWITFHLEKVQRWSIELKIQLSFTNEGLGARRVKIAMVWGDWFWWYGLGTESSKEEKNHLNGNGVQEQVIYTDSGFYISSFLLQHFQLCFKFNFSLQVPQDLSIDGKQGEINQVKLGSKCCTQRNLVRQTDVKIRLL